MARTSRPQAAERLPSTRRTRRRSPETETPVKRKTSRQPHEAGLKASIARKDSDDVDQVAPTSQSLAVGAYFRLMDLPTELRLQVFRCALVRPYPILMHKEPPAVESPSLPVADLAPTIENANVQPPYIPDARTADTTTVGSQDEGVVIVPRRRSLRRRHLRTPTSLTPATQAAIKRMTLSLSADAGQSHVASIPPAVASSPTTPHPDTTMDPLAFAQLPWQERRIRYSGERRPQDDDPLDPVLLCLSKQIYKEARQILYSENVFILSLNSAIPAIGSLHQRSRSMIKHVRLTVPSHHDILERFAEIVRLSLRYCWGLKSFTIILPFVFSINDHAADGSFMRVTTATTMHVYANAFNILRWLPKTAEVVLEGVVCDEIRHVIAQNANLAKTLDEKAYARRQHQISDSALGPEVKP